MAEKLAGKAGRQAVRLGSHQRRRKRQAADLSMSGREADAKLWIRVYGTADLDVLDTALHRRGGMDDNAVRFLKNDLHVFDAVRGQQLFEGWITGKRDVDVVLREAQGARAGSWSGNSFPKYVQMLLRFRDLVRRRTQHNRRRSRSGAQEKPAEAGGSGEQQENEQRFAFQGARVT